jgi:hypothetical protein
MSEPAKIMEFSTGDIHGEPMIPGYDARPPKSELWGSPVEVVKNRMEQDYSVPQSLFSGTGITLRAAKPISVKISRGEESWFAENEPLDIFANGDSAEAAMKEFKSLLVEFYLHYKRLSPERAMSGAKRLKQLFEERFFEVD